MQSRSTSYEPLRTRMSILHDLRCSYIRPCVRASVAHVTPRNRQTDCVFSGIYVIEVYSYSWIWIWPKIHMTRRDKTSCIPGRGSGVSTQHQQGFRQVATRSHHAVKGLLSYRVTLQDGHLIFRHVDHLQSCSTPSNVDSEQPPFIDAVDDIFAVSVAPPCTVPANDLASLVPADDPLTTIPCWSTERNRCSPDWYVQFLGGGNVMNGSATWTQLCLIVICTLSNWKAGRLTGRHGQFQLLVR